MSLAETINAMYDYELSLGGRASKQYALLQDVKRRELPLGDFPSLLFFNPGRIRSVMADVSAETLAKRPCFLCPSGLEEMQQTYIWEPASPLADVNDTNDTIPSGNTATAPHTVNKGYYVRVNPFPIFHHHFTISSMLHEPQQLRGHYRDMLLLAEEMPEYTIFYNGPRCGASAPDHMHFQAVPIGSLPMQTYCDTHGHTSAFCPSAHLVEGSDILDMERQLFALIGEYHRKDIRPTVPQQDPPCLDDADFNLITWYTQGRYKSVILFRRQARPACFFADNPDERILMSPGAVEMSGVGIVSDEACFHRLTAHKLHEIIREVSVEE